VKPGQVGPPGQLSPGQLRFIKARLEQVENLPEPVRFHGSILPTRPAASLDRACSGWVAALGYELAPAPAGFATWNDFYRELGLPEEDLADGADRINDPEGHGPSIWFHVVPEAKAVKNRLHFDIHASGEWTDPIETRRRRVDAEAGRLAALGATTTGALSEEGLDHYAVGMKDPEGNEFDIN
jgi:Glyoxalase-like domain